MKRLVWVGLAVLFVASGVVFGMTLGKAFDAPAEMQGEPLLRPVAAPPVTMGKPAPERTEVPANVLTLNQLFKEVARDVTPAVVSIEVELSPSERRGRREQDFFRRGPATSAGSGVIISEQGYIVTNNHVVQDAQRITVLLNDKREYQARVVGTDPSTDLAVIKISEQGELPVVALGDSDELEVGEWVMAIGNPFRLSSTVTAGIVSALGRQVNIINDSFGIEDFIQTDAAINPGNSGGALVNLHGELIGINTAIATETGSYEGYGFAVPVNLMQRVAADLIQYGEVQRGFLGVSLGEVNATLSEELGLERIEGVLIQSVQGGTAADKAGLERRDVILAVDGKPVYAVNQLQAEIAQRRPGDEVTFDVWRRGRVRAFRVQLFGRDAREYQNWVADMNAQQREFFEQFREEEGTPEQEPEFERFEEEALGIALRDLSPREMQAFGVEAGAYIAYVRGGSPADAMGLPRDAVVTHVGNQKVTSAEETLKVLTMMRTIREHGGVDEGILLRVQRRDGVTAFYDLEVDEIVQ